MPPQPEHYPHWSDPGDKPATLTYKTVMELAARYFGPTQAERDNHVSLIDMLKRERDA